ncbi:Uracil-DNA glycosylase [Halapricum desulfuricans]|uniref:Uracil-DNA glycosylase n=1 Tax=Halapricum desulfuricans TaxID=2841257 RepID=A0A897N4M9_9EURY|nr:Uracil-DNA glycosylase [Halapricum desulfuricans]
MINHIRGRPLREQSISQCLWTGMVRLSEYPSLRAVSESSTIVRERADETVGVFSFWPVGDGVKNVTHRQSNPFGMDPDCQEFVPGYGDANAHFHVIGDHPGVHGGTESGIPFTGTAASERLQRALLEAGLLESTGTPPTVDRTYFSYLYMCVHPGEPTDSEYADLERFFDSELRAITAHVLLPVGQRATEYALANYSARNGRVDMDELHASEIQGAGWLIYPIKDPREWTDDDERALIDALVALQQRDYRQEVDLGRFIPGGDPYRVR